jgi:hypothetical protein
MLAERKLSHASGSETASDGGARMAFYSRRRARSTGGRALGCASVPGYLSAGGTTRGALRLGMTKISFGDHRVGFWFGRELGEEFAELVHTFWAEAAAPFFFDCGDD